MKSNLNKTYKNEIDLIPINQPDIYLDFKIFAVDIVTN